MTRSARFAKNLTIWRSNSNLAERLRAHEALKKSSFWDVCNHLGNFGHKTSRFWDGKVPENLKKQRCQELPNADGHSLMMQIISQTEKNVKCPMLPKVSKASLGWKTCQGMRVGNCTLPVVDPKPPPGLSANSSPRLGVKVRISSSASNRAESTRRTGVKWTAFTSKSASSNLSSQNITQS